MSPKSYVQKAIANHFDMFGEMPKVNVWSPLEKGYHPELDTSDELNMEDIKLYQSLIGILQ